MNLRNLAIESCASALVVIDSAARIVDVNETACLLFSYSKKELLDSNIEALIPQSFHSEHAKHIKDFFLNPTFSIMGKGRQLSARKKDGSTFYVDVRLSNFKTDGVTYAVANILDIDEEITLLTLLASTQEIAKIGSWRVDLGTNRVIWSKMVYEIHEIDESTAINLEDGISFYVAAHRPIITKLVNQCISTKEPWDAELKITTASGQEKWIHSIGSAIVNDKGSVTGLEGTFRDIQENKLIRLEREEALNKLERTEQLSKTGHWEWTLEPEKLEWSKGLYALWGLDPSVPPPSIEEHRQSIHPDDQEQFYSQLEYAIQNRAPYSVNFRIVAGNKVKYIYGQGNPLMSADGTLLGFFGSAQDVTQRETARLKRDMLNKRAKLALDAADTGVWDLDVVTNELTWDDRMLSLYGLTRDEFIGAYEAWSKGLHPDDRETSEKQLQQAIEGKAKFDTTFRVVWPNGEVRDIRALADVIRDPKGNAIRMIGVNWDITDDIRQRRLLQTSNERYELMAQGSSVGIWDWPDINGNTEYWSQKFYELLGYKEGEIEASLENFSNLLHPDDSERTFTLVNEHLSHMVPFDLEYRLKTKSGGYRWFRGTGKASRNASGIPVRMVGSIQDIHEQVTSKANLEKVNEELVQISYRTSHDLRAPLTTSKRLAEFVVQDIESGNSSEATKNAVKIQQQMERLELLISDILDLARAELRTEKDEILDFDKIGQEVCGNLAWMIEGSECQIDFNVQMTEQIKGEKSRFYQIIENLVSNSIKYKNADRELMRVDISVSDDDQYIYINIKDNGIGIPELSKENVFKMFKRFHPGISSGSGLGLSIVKKHVDYMKGDITFDSSSEGTEFKIKIPKVQEEKYD